MLLFAPDVVKGADGRFYLYYSMAHSSRMSVAVCNTPAGHYEYYGDVKTSDGRIYGIDKGDMLQFDLGYLQMMMEMYIYIPVFVRIRRKMSMDVLWQEHMYADLVMI